MPVAQVAPRRGTKAELLEQVNALQARVDSLTEQVSMLESYLAIEKDKKRQLSVDLDWFRKKYVDIEDYQMPEKRSAWFHLA